jgi:hypothetical protein
MGLGEAGGGCLGVGPAAIARVAIPAAIGRPNGPMWNLTSALMTGLPVSVW